MAPTITIEAPGTKSSYRATDSKRAALDRIDMLARVFDTAFAIPGTNFCFGIEAVMRLVPGIGDAAASALSCYLLYEAHRLDVPKPVFARLVANVAIEGVVGAETDIGKHHAGRDLVVDPAVDQPLQDVVGLHGPDDGGLQRQGGVDHVSASAMIFLRARVIRLRSRFFSRR